jgi:hypothetical protein
MPVTHVVNMKIRVWFAQCGVWWLCIAPLTAQLPAPATPRTWRSTEGQTFSATLLSFDGTTAIFKMANGQRAQAPAAKLSAEDQAFLADWQKKQPIKVVLPDVVGVETANVKAEVVSEDPVKELFVYRTQHFEFESAGKFNQTLLREVGRNFEATYELVKALPWGIDPKPSGSYFKARLFKTKEAYHAAGGPPNSGGFYRSGDDTFYVPFENIGVKVVGKSYAKDDDFRYDTMVHELTHQMMHFWLRPLPQWVTEGSAEYTSNLPLRTGKFRVSAAKNGLKDYTEFLKKRAVGGMPEPYPLEKLFRVSNEEWGEILASDPSMSRRLYFTSYLLVYYFMHLDGKGDGERFARYFREIGELRKANPRVDEEGAQSALKILLDGRSEAELMKQIRSAYAKLGIRL